MNGSIDETEINRQDSIWYKRSWGRPVKGTIDGRLYGLFTAGA